MVQQKQSVWCGIKISILLVAGILGGCSSFLPMGEQAAGQSDASTATQAGVLTLAPAGDQADNSGTLEPLAETPFPSATPVPLPTPDPWTGEERVNVLILGLDYGDWNSPDRQGPPRSDTMMLLTIDPETKTAGILSIPRDLWVDIPGMVRPNRINAAHRFGELYELPGGGPALAARTVENLLGVPVHFYARIDFSAFERFIDEIGGVEVDVPEEIKVDPIGPGNTVFLEPGIQTLDGPTALAYARNRSTQGDEIDRAKRQQQIIFAIRQRLLTLNGLPRLVAKAPALYRQLSSGIASNLSLEQAVQLAWLAAQVDRQDIQSTAIGPNEYIVETTEEGWSVFRPIPERIQWLVQQVFSSP